MRALVTGHATAACWGNSSRDVSCCETPMFPSGKSNISLGCQQDRYFPNGLWEAAAPLFLPCDCEQRCLSAWYEAGAERGVEKGAAGCGQPESSRGRRGPRAALGRCTRGELSRRAPALWDSGAKLRCRGLLHGWDGSHSHQLLPVAISYSWGWERELGDCRHRNARESPP